MDKPASSVPDLIKQIITAGEVKHVVCVDDDFALGLNFTIVRELCVTMPAEAAEIADLKDIRFADDVEDWGPQLSKKWEALDSMKRRVIDEQLRSKAKPDVLPRAHCLQGLFPSTCTFVALSLVDWRKSKTNVLEKAKKEKTLLIIDQDLSPEGGTDEEGIKIIADALRTVTGGNLVCVLLSHTFAEGQEHDRWVDFADRHDLDRDRFMLSSKERINEPPVGFAMMIKLALINPLCQQFRSQVATVIHESITGAIDKVKGINIYELDRMVFEASRKEGVWEPDTMFRLFGVYQRVEARRLAKKSGALSDTAERIRALSAIDTDSVPDRPASWRIRRLEMYEDGEYLNNHYLPTELGDVYEGKGGKKYILLDQPCDLSVRSNGSRNSAEDVTVACLAERPSNLPGGWFKLDFFDPAIGADWYVIFRDVFTVPLDVLDFCSLRADGTCEISDSDVTPSGVIPSWQRRHLKLKGCVQSVVKYYNDVMGKIQGKAGKADFSNVAPDLTEYAVGRVFNPHPKKLFGGTLDLATNTLRFDCKRIRRLCQPWSTALLTHYSQFLSRAAFEHGYGSEHYRPLQ